MEYEARLRPCAGGLPKEIYQGRFGIRHLRIGEERPNSITDYATVSIGVRRKEPRTTAFENQAGRFKKSNKNGRKELIRQVYWGLGSATVNSCLV